MTPLQRAEEMRRKLAEADHRLMMQRISITRSAFSRPRILGNFVPWRPE